MTPSEREVKKLAMELAMQCYGFWAVLPLADKGLMLNIALYILNNYTPTTRRRRKAK